MEKNEQKKADRIEYVFRNKTYIATPGYIFKRKFNHIDE